MPTAAPPLIGTQVFSWPRIVSPEEIQSLCVPPPPGLETEITTLECGVPLNEVNASRLPVQMCKTRGRRVSFSDKVLGGLLADVSEVESFKEFNKETWRSASAYMELGAEDKQWCNDLLEKLASPVNEIRKSTLLELHGLILVLSLLPEGSDVVRCALEVARCGEEHQMLARALRGHVQELASSPHGSEVLQSCLEVMKPETVRFIPGELREHAISVASQEHGSEVLCRLLEHLPLQETSSLTKKLLEHCASLCQDEFGNRVVQHILEYGSQSQQIQICQVLADGLPIMALHTTVRDVLKTALNTACPEACGILKDKLLSASTSAWQSTMFSAAEHCHFGSMKVHDGTAMINSTVTPSLMTCSPVKLELAPPMHITSPTGTGLTGAKKDVVHKPHAVVPSKTRAKKAAAAALPITTLMIRGIPCSCTQEQVLEFLNALGFQGRYNFFYLPRKSPQSNLGYAFVNFKDSAWAHACNVTLHGKSLDPMRSKKVLSVSSAHIQGLANLDKHFRHTCVSKNSGARGGPVFLKTSN